MKLRRVWVAVVVLGLCVGHSGVRAAPSGDPPPDPKQIPVPALHTSFPRLPGVDKLPAQPELPPVLRTSEGRAVASAKDWPARRSEMQAILEHYALGHAPPAPGNLRGSEIEARELDKGVRYRLVRLSFGPAELQQSVDIGIFTPAGAGPFPAVISPVGLPRGARSLPRLPLGPGQGKGVDALLGVGPGPAPSLPQPTSAPSHAALARSQPALSRGFAVVVFEHNDFGEDTTLRDADGGWAFRRTRVFPAYPGYDWGLLRAWSWGVSRIVDYLVTDASIDARKLVVTGFSRTGKSALIAGAFDERIAVTAPVATGGGGVGTFRNSGAGRGGKEGLDVMLRKYPNWFSPELYPFWGHTDQLPFDQHWLLALVAPRALIALEGTTDPVSLASAVRSSWSGAQPAYALLGASAALGVHYARRGHAVTPEDWKALLDFAEQQFAHAAGPRRFDRFPAEAFQANEGSAAKRVALWNGRDLRGWKLYSEPPDPKSAVVLKGGVLRFESAAKGYVQTEESFQNYHLHVEWRWPKGSKEDANSGVLVHVTGPDAIWPLCFECQLKSNNAGQVVGMGLDIPAAPVLNNRKRAPRLGEVFEQPYGEWNSYEIYCRADTIEAYVNGVRQNYVEALPMSAGRIALQMEGFPIEFRNVWLEPL